MMMNDCASNINEMCGIWNASEEARNACKVLSVNVMSVGVDQKSV